MKIYRYQQDDLTSVFCRSQLNDEQRNARVEEIIANVREKGDKALFAYTERFDGLKLTAETVAVNEEEFEQAYRSVSSETLAALWRAKDRVYAYHCLHRAVDSLKTEGGVTTGQLIRPVKRAGIYVPGGTAAYPSSVLMCVLPARAAGVEEIYICSPNPRNALTLVAAKECGATKVFKVGGAQAIAAMAYGTESIPKTDVIAGPGNAYVAVAKKKVFGDVKIDMIAGPSEILVLADEHAQPKRVAADLLSQAEHDALSAAILVCTSLEFAHAVRRALEEELSGLPRKDIASRSVRDNGAIIVVNDLKKEGVEIANKIAPEHLELQVEDPENYLPFLQNAGAIFGGYHTCEPIGDYYAGPSHVLPTSGTARYAEVLNTDTFLKKMSYIRYDESELKNVGEDVIRLATEEGFQAHAYAVKVRME